jgi:hypothetical protein
MLWYCTSGLEQVFTQEERRLISEGYPIGGVEVVLRLTFASLISLRNQRGWDDEEIAGRFREAVARLVARYPIPEAWESIQARRFETGGIGVGFKSALFEAIRAAIELPVYGDPGPNATEDDLTPAPAVLERFEGFVEQIEGNVAYVVLRAENGDELYGEYPADRLARLGVEETDRFLCLTVKDVQGTRVEIEPLASEPVSDEDVRAIFERISHALGPGDDGVEF